MVNGELPGLRHPAGLITLLCNGHIVLLNVTKAVPCNTQACWTGPSRVVQIGSYERKNRRQWSISALRSPFGNPVTRGPSQSRADGCVVAHLPSDNKSFWKASSLTPKDTESLSLSQRYGPLTCASVVVSTGTGMTSQSNHSRSAHSDKRDEGPE